MKIDSTTLSSAITSAEKVDLEYFKKLGSPVVDWIAKPIASAKNLLGKIAAGAKELINSIKNGSFLSIFQQWAKDDPLAAGAGVIAAGLAAGTLLIVGGAVVGWVFGSVGAVASSLGTVALVGGGGGIGAIVGGLLNTAETIYAFNWQISDKEIMGQIESAINNLYEPAGEFLGRTLAGVLVGGLTSPPKVQINVRALTLQWALNPDIRQDLLQGVSELAYLGMQAGIQIAIKYAFMQGRRGIKNLWKKAPSTVKKLFPQVDQAIKTWGDEGKEPWSMESWVNEKVESIEDQRLEDAVQGFLSGFWQQFRQSIEYVYV